MILSVKREGESYRASYIDESPTEKEIFILESFCYILKNFERTSFLDFIDKIKKHTKSEKAHNLIKIIFDENPRYMQTLRELKKLNGGKI